MSEEQENHQRGIDAARDWATELLQQDPRGLTPHGRMEQAMAAMFLHDLVNAAENSPTPVRQIASMFTDVIEFHKKFLIDYNGPPRLLPPELLKARRQRTEEEEEEYAQAIQDDDIVGQVDALIDGIYFKLGTLRLMGVDADECFARVHGANMLKMRATEKNPGKHKSMPDGDVLFCDVVKPPGWTHPDLSDLCGVPKEQSTLPGAIIGEGNPK